MDKSESLNLYGDKVVTTTGTHGADIASQRMDDLDRKCIEHALRLNNKNIYALEIGCGLGIQGVRLAVLGIETLLIDILDISETVEALTRLLGIGNLELLIKDARNITHDDIQSSPDIVFSQRFIHYLKYTEARTLIACIATIMQPGSMLFISASGLYSELGQGYKDKELPLHERYCNLDNRMAEKHQIKESVCLYSEQDIKILVEPFDFTPVEVWSSSFGNIKAIFKKKEIVGLQETANLLRW